SAPGHDLSEVPAVPARGFLGPPPGHLALLHPDAGRHHRARRRAGRRDARRARRQRATRLHPDLRRLGSPGCPRGPVAGARVHRVSPDGGRDDPARLHRRDPGGHGLAGWLGGRRLRDRHRPEPAHALDEPAARGHRHLRDHDRRADHAAAGLPRPGGRAGVIGWRALVVAVLLAALPLWPWMTQYYLLLAFDALLFGAIAMSLDLLMGYTGLVSFGHAAFYGLGAYATAVLLERGVLSLWACLGFAVVVVGL